MTNQPSHNDEPATDIETLLDEALQAERLLVDAPDRAGVELADRIFDATRNQLPTRDRRTGVIARFASPAFAAAAVLAIATAVWFAMDHARRSTPTVPGADTPRFAADSTPPPSNVAWSDQTPDDTFEEEFIALEAELAFASIDGRWGDEAADIDDPSGGDTPFDADEDDGIDPPMF